MSINKLATEIHEIAKSKGWYDEPDNTFSDMISNAHGELSEAWEEYRKGKIVTGTYRNCPPGYDADCDDNCEKCIIQKPEGIPIELADCIIRILDFCAYAGIDIEESIRIKNEYNKTRSYRHGGKIK
jgi:NTP pyrophosphatase (non-canonical NTP hydrolase)